MGYNYHAFFDPPRPACTDSLNFEPFQYRETVSRGSSQSVQIFELSPRILSGNTEFIIRGFRPVQYGTSAGELGPAITFGIISAVGVVAAGVSVYYSRRVDRRAVNSATNSTGICGVCLETIANLLRNDPHRCPDCESIEFPACHFCLMPPGRARIFKTRSLEREVVLTDPSRKCRTCEAIYFVQLSGIYSSPRASVDSTASFITAREL
ncbi:hypothetical protein V500_00166 [Pseudogymnoascus sp. VKM F-4518 (FW-2643)]|nr:hypothetical protein V500_00166 [Pseudogymnoascus sp. VKM F-4518 (FW-2643)]